MDTETSIRPDALRPLGMHDRWAREPWRHWVRWSASTLVLIILGTFVFTRGDRAAVKYVTQEVTRGSLTVTVSATGNVEPRNQVDIGSELSGKVRSVMVDVNDNVMAGQVLAELDTTRLKAQVLQAESLLATTQARVLQSAARLRELRANLARLLKVRELSRNQLPSHQDLDVAEAAVAHAEGEDAAARADVAQARAILDTVRTDLGKTDIVSPIDGVVLVRSVEPGQTVAASLQAPVLFTLAEDLKKMDLHVAVDEADVGSISVAQQANFTVDAFPNRVFQARITQVHLASSNTPKGVTRDASGNDGANSTDVVAYDTVLEVDNSELLLRPGMTATAEIQTHQIQGAVLVPNAAMRFQPDRARFPDMHGDSERARGLMFIPHLTERWKCPREKGRAIGCVWVLENGQPELVIFKPGATDRNVTQILPLDRLPKLASLARSRNDPVLVRALARKLEPGMQVIVDSTQPSRD